MAKVLAVGTLLAAAVAANGATPPPSSDQSFTTGFFAGLQVNNPDQNECLRDYAMEKGALPSVFTACEAAVEDPTNMYKQVFCTGAATHLAVEFTTMAANCHLGGLTAELKSLTTLSGLKDAFGRAYSDRSTLMADLQGSLAAYKAQDYLTSGVYAGKATALLLTPSLAPNAQPLAGAPPMAAVDYTALAEGLFVGLQANNPDAVDCITQAPNLAPAIKDVLANCNFGSAAPSPLSGASNACFTALSSAFSATSSLLKVCHAAALAEEIGKLATPTGFIAALTRYAENKNDVESDAMNAYRSFTTDHDYLTAGVYAGKGIVLVVDGPNPDPQTPPLRTILAPSAKTASPPSSSSSVHTSLRKGVGRDRPFVVFHGLGDQCSNHEMERFVYDLIDFVNLSYGVCLEIGDGAGDSWGMSFAKQAELACNAVKADPNLKGGFNAIGLSQGALLARYVAQVCEDAPPVFNVISIGGPQMGTATIPNCHTGIFCNAINAIVKLGVYTESAQDHVGPAGYFKDPARMATYQTKSVFLADFNNEGSHPLSTDYATRIAALESLVLIKFTGDTIIDPPESEWFGYFDTEAAEKGERKIVALQNSTMYINDKLGLRNLDMAHRIQFVALPGNHLEFTRSDMVKYMVPALL